MYMGLGCTYCNSHGQSSMGSRSWTIRLIGLAAALGLAGCSGGSSPSEASAQSPAPTAQVRLINSMADASVEMSVRTTALRLAPRAIAVLPVPPGPTVITARWTSDAQVTVDVVAGRTENIVFTLPAPARPQLLSLGSLAGATSGAQLSYYHAAPAYSAIDVYAVLPGGSIQATTATIPSALPDRMATANLLPGSYEMVITPAGKKTELFRSGAIAIGAGQAAAMIGARRSPSLPTPQPILVTEADAASIEDSRPAVRVLLPSRAVTLIRIVVDGETLVDSTAILDDLRYHLSPGPHLMVHPLIGLQQPFSIEAGRTYFQTFTVLGAWLLNTQFLFGWDIPRPTADLPVPQGWARVRLEVRDSCAPSDIYVNGASLLSGVNTGTALRDLEPGPLEVTSFSAGTTIREAAIATQLAADRYYVVRALRNPVLHSCDSPQTSRILEVHRGR